MASTPVIQTPPIAASLPPQAVRFPGKVAVVKLSRGREICLAQSLTSLSPDHAWIARFSSRPSAVADGCAYRLAIRRHDADRSFKVDDFGRWAAMSWAPAGHRFFLVDGMGSNITDCLVETPDRDGVVQLDLTSVIRHSEGPLRPSETPNRSHYYLECRRWIGQNQVEGTISGRTDDKPFHAFCVRFRYDLAARSASWGPVRRAQDDISC